ncbi:MAG: hypothetical protein HQ519_00040 [Planctomycetes bacterium]|nr:hypothetical protein [Planctomycetota bacterium]
MKIYLITMLAFTLAACSFLDYATKTSTDPYITKLQTEFAGLEEDYSGLETSYKNLKDKYLLLAGKLKEEGLSAESAKEVALGMADAMEKMTVITGTMGQMKERARAIQASIAEKANEDNVPWWYVVGAAGIALLTGGAMPTMNGIPILGRLLPKTAPLLKKLGLRNEEERKAYHMG